MLFIIFHFLVLGGIISLCTNIILRNLNYNQTFFFFVALAAFFNKL